VIFLVCIFLDWASAADEPTQTAEGTEGTVETTSTGFNGYEADSLVPFAAFLGIGFAIALLYAANIAYRRQHRGLSLSSMAVGKAVTLLSLAWVFNVPGAAERSDELGLTSAPASASSARSCGRSDRRCRPRSQRPNSPTRRPRDAHGPRPKDTRTERTARHLT